MRYIAAVNQSKNTLEKTDSKTMKLPSILLVALCGLALCAEPVPGTVIATRLNVRTKPMAGGEVICRLKKGEKVSILEFKNDWLAIVPPASARGWIKKDAVKEGVVTQNAKVHAGPGTVFTSFAEVTQGTKVSVNMSKGSWIQIKGSLGGRLWVHGDYIDVPQKHRPGKPVAAVQQPRDENAGRPPSETVNPKPELATKKPGSLPIKLPQNVVFHQLEGGSDSAEIVPVSTAKRIVKTGVLIKLPRQQGPWTHALAAQINNRFYPLFYVNNSYEGLENWTWHRVRITGDQQWVRGWPRPMVEVREIEDSKD